MKNKEFYADKIIEIAIRGSKIGVDENTRRPFCCSSRCCDECIEYVGYCDEDRLKEWANAEYIEAFDKDEVVLTRMVSPINGFLATMLIIKMVAIGFILMDVHHLRRVIYLVR